MQRVSQQAAKSAVKRAVAAKPPCPQAVPSSSRLGGQDWAAGAPEASAAQMHCFWTHLRTRDLVSLEVPGTSNNCAYRLVGHQVLGLSVHQANVQVADVAQLLREMVHNFLHHVTSDELSAVQAVPTAPLQWVASMQGLGGPGAQQRSVSEVVAAHLAAVKSECESTDLELSALASVLDLDYNNVALLMYGPLYPAARDYCYTLTTTTAEQARQVVRVEWVPAGGAGELNHFVVLKPHEVGSGWDESRVQKKPRHTAREQV